MQAYSNDRIMEDEIKYAYNKVCKENKKPLLVNNEVYIFVD